MRLRTILLTAHLWTGLAAAPFLLVLGATGAVMVFENEIDDALNARLTRVTSSGPALSLAAIETRLDSTYRGYRVVEAVLPADDRHAYLVGAAGKDLRSEVGLFVDQHDGRILGTPEQGTPVMSVVHQLHTHFLAGRKGALVSAAGALLLLFLAVTGLILWWPAKIMRVQWNGGVRRLVFDLHQTVGAAAFAGLFLFAATGLVVHFDDSAGGWLARLTHAAPLAPLPRQAPACAPGQGPLGADQLLATARAQVAGARATLLQMAPGRPVRVQLKYPEDHTPAGRTQVFLSPCTGQVLALRSSRTMAFPFRYVSMWNREIHTGDVWGWPTRILAALFSLSLPLMALTGPLIWWTKRKKSAAA